MEHSRSSTHTYQTPSIQLSSRGPPFSGQRGSSDNSGKNDRRPYGVDAYCQEWNRREDVCYPLRSVVVTRSGSLRQRGARDCCDGRRLTLGRMTLFTAVAMPLRLTTPSQRNIPFGGLALRWTSPSDSLSAALFCLSKSSIENIRDKSAMTRTANKSIHSAAVTSANAYPHSIMQNR